MNELFVGHVRVLSTDPDGRPRVQVLGGDNATCTADWAIPFRYEPVAGDLLQVLGQNGRYWVTGVVHGRGNSRLAFRGTVALQASGVLRLRGDAGIRLEAPEVRFESAQVDTEAEVVVQRFDDSDATVHGVLEERAGTCERTIDGEDQVTAARHETVAAHTVKVDAELLRLS